MMHRCLFVAFVLCACSGSADAATVIDPAHYAIRLTDLGAGVIPTAINSVGQVAGNANGQAFRWEDGTLTPLGTLGGAQSYANDLNDAGTVVGWAHDSAGKMKSFKWNGAMTNLDATVAFDGAAEGINNNETVVGWRSAVNSFRSVRWNEFSEEGDFLFGDYDHKALAVNDNEGVVGISIRANGEPEDGYYWNSFGGPDSVTGRLASDYFPYAGINNNDLTAGEQLLGAAYMWIDDFGTSEIRKLLPTDPFQTVHGLNDLDVLVGESGNKGFIYELRSRSGPPVNNPLYDINGFASIGFLADAITRLIDINNSNVFTGIALLDGTEHGIVGQFVPLLAGDYDLDHDVDGADYIMWREQFGVPSVPYAGADGNGDGMIDAADYVVWRKNVGGMTVARIAAPEPHSTALFIVGLALSQLWRRHRSK